jgi:hypothetical protein
MTKTFVQAFLLTSTENFFQLTFHYSSLDQKLWAGDDVLDQVIDSGRFDAELWVASVDWEGESRAVLGGSSSGHWQGDSFHWCTLSSVLPCSLGSPSSLSYHD